MRALSLEQQQHRQKSMSSQMVFFSSVVLLGSINGMVDYYLRDVVLTDRYGLFHDPCGEPRARNRASAQLDRNQGQHAG